MVVLFVDPVSISIALVGQYISSVSTHPVSEVYEIWARLYAIFRELFTFCKPMSAPAKPVQESTHSLQAGYRSHLQQCFSREHQARHEGLHPGMLSRRSEEFRLQCVHSEVIDLPVLPEFWIQLALR